MTEQPSSTFLCPHCNVVSLHTPNGFANVYEQSVVLEGQGGTTYPTKVQMNHMILKCVNCHNDTYRLVMGEAKVYGTTGITLAERPSKVIHQYPISTPSVDPSVNQDVRNALVEAEKCFSVQAFNACGVMTRRAIHSLCADKKASGKTLYEQLEYLKDNHLLTPDLWEWAEELRVVGKIGAHPEWLDVSPEDAEYALRFLREIVRYVYINPAERAARKLKETAKKKQ